MPLKSKLLLALSLFFLIRGEAQTYYFDNYSVEDGLSQSTVYVVYQDKEGYVWIGTKSGVSRFDGAEILNYTSNDGLAGNAVRSIAEDSAGTIWFGHAGGGVSRKINNRFENIHFDSLEINTDIASIVVDHKQQLWLGSLGNGAINISNPQAALESLNYKNYKGKEGLSDRVFQLYLDRSGAIYFVTDVGLKQYKHKEKAFSALKLEGLPTYFQVTCVHRDRKGDLWLGTYHGGLYQYIQKEKKFKIYDTRDGLANNWVSTIAETSDGDLWIGTWEGGLSRISNGQFYIYNTDNGLHDNKVRSIHEDREGNVLIGTNENGLDIFKGQEFVSYSKRDGLISEQVWAVLEDNIGEIWLGTNKGIAILSLNLPKAEQFTFMDAKNNYMSSDDIRFLKMDDYANVWVGTNGGGLMRFNFSISRNQEYVTIVNQQIRHGTVTALDVDKYNNVWVGTLEGLIKYNSKLRDVRTFSQIDGLLDNDITVIYCDDNGVVWVGCRGKGLNKIVGKKIEKVDLGGEITINSIVKDQNGMLWLGTDGQGLLVCDKNDSIVDHYKTSDGLLSDLITLVNEDEDGNIWIGSNKGLNKYVPSKRRFFTYTDKSGFTGIEAKSNASFHDSKGNMWFGTVGGVMKYNLKHQREDYLEPLTHITELMVNLNKVDMEQGMVFDHTQRNFYFSYNSVYLTNPTSVRYLVKLEGVDENWSFPTTLTFANYPALPPGKYTFKVKAGNNAGIWNEKPVEFHFTIDPPFWQTWWFYLSVVVFLVTGIIYFIKLREQNLRREKKILEDKVAERTAEVVIKNEELASKNKDITDSIRYAKRIQNAVLPPDEMINQSLKNAFILFRPKDIVSGDFYWVASKNEKTLFAAVDCTGHGVPGAFMSIIGHNSLDKIVGEMDITQPAQILDELNKGVSHTLRQKSEDSEVKDGMDISLVSIDLKNMLMEFAGAHNSLYLIRDGEIHETKPDKFAIGSFVKQEKRNFKNHEIEIKKGDMIYVFSDGYADQFGGELGKKFKYRPFKELLLASCNLPVQEQRDKIEAIFVDWMGGVHEQIDDVLIIGVKI
jgi:ligand-binding sensor domain-containing protein/serine phosphatase RsbU (regulator of sigma subunit)